MAKRTVAEAVRPIVHIEIDLGDTSVILQEHGDGMFTFDLDDTRLVLTADQTADLTRGFLTLALRKGWHVTEG